MAYGNGGITTFSFGEHDFGAATERLSFQLPNGMQGRLLDVVVSATETFNAVTTEGEVNVGSAAGGQQYAACGLGTTADLASYRATDNAGDIVSAELPADADIHVEFKAPTGGTPAGRGFVQLVVYLYGENIAS